MERNEVQIDLIKFCLSNTKTHSAILRRLVSGFEYK
jgi:hypothetical protein